MSEYDLITANQLIESSKIPKGFAFLIKHYKKLFMIPETYLFILYMANYMYSNLHLFEAGLAFEFFIYYPLLPLFLFFSGYWLVFQSTIRESKIAKKLLLIRALLWFFVTSIVVMMIWLPISSGSWYMIDATIRFSIILLIPLLSGFVIGIKINDAERESHSS